MVVALPVYIQETIMRKYFTSHVLRRLREGIDLIAYNKYARDREHDDVSSVTHEKFAQSAFEWGKWNNTLPWSIKL